MLVSEGREKGAHFSEGVGRLHSTCQLKSLFFGAVKAGEGLQCRGAKGCVPVPRSHTADQRISARMR